MIGQTISHYRILEKLGEGGMGVVYRAHDAKLDRDVALKFLPQQITVSEEDKARFLQEAKAISALNHPNIATIYDVDEADAQKFLVLEYIPGGTLKSKLKRLKSEDKEFLLADVLDYGIQAAEALAHAHRRQIIHRDVKTDNLMLTDEGKLKLTDFGLAKLRGSAQVTKTGTTVGTAAYMSPEQIRGEEVDQRSDIFSLGVVLYELLTSRLPFRGEFETALNYSILNEDPPSVKSLRKETPPELEKIVHRCLEKEKANRYQNADEVVSALREVQKGTMPAVSARRKTKKLELIAGGSIIIVALIALAYFFWPAKPAASVGKSIAVLPFADMSPQKDQEWFCDGMAESLIDRLTNIKELKVVARTSAFAFKGKTQDIREIGKRLGVETVLEGSIQRVGDRLRVTAQLANVADGYHFWSETYDRQLKDNFDIQDEIALTIADKMKLELLGAEKAKLTKRYTENTEAYLLYLKGNSLHYLTYTAEGLQQAIECFEQALKRDSSFALAYAGLADTYYDLPFIAPIPPKESLAKAKTYLKKALEIDDNLGEAHAALGRLAAMNDWNWTESEREFERALELNPNSPIVHLEHVFALTIMGRHKEAIKEARQARELDPLSGKMITVVGETMFWAGQFDEAIEDLKKTIGMDTSQYYPRYLLGITYQAKHLMKESLAELEKSFRLPEADNPATETTLAVAYYLNGQRAEADKLLDTLEKKAKHGYVSATWLYLVHRARGEPDEAFKYLVRACQDHEAQLTYCLIWPDDAYRFPSDQRTTDLLKKVGLLK